MFKADRLPILIICLNFVNFSNACVNNKLHMNQLLGEEHISALILARGNSKGIPLKNISKFGKKTLITNVLDVIKNIRFDSVWVSTDSWMIFNTISTDPVNIHWRSEESATDTASSIYATIEFLKSHPEIDVVALIQCTSPFLKQIYLEQALNLLKSGKDCVFSVTRSFKLRWKKRREKLIPLNFNPESRPRRQDWNGELVENGMFYVAKKTLIFNGIFQNDNCGFVEIPASESLEIDTPLDLIVANTLHKLKSVKVHYEN